MIFFFFLACVFYCSFLNYTWWSKKILGQTYGTWICTTILATGHWASSSEAWCPSWCLFDDWRKCSEVSALSFNSVRGASEQWLAAFLQDSGCRADSSKLPALDVTELCSLNSGLRFQTSCLNRALILPVPIITNSCTHSTIFIKNTLKAHVKFTPTCFGSQMEPSSGGQHLILAKVYMCFNGASPYSQYCGGIRKPMCVYC